MRRKLNLLFYVLALCSSTLLAQQMEVTGIVLGDDNLGIPGVNIIVKGTTTGTVTDVDGNYKITVPGANSTLLFSYVGFLSQEIAVGNQTRIDVTLELDVTGLEEIVVVGYGTISKQNLTTAIAKVDPDDVPLAANNSVSELLFGRAAGLQAIQQSAEPGGDIDLSIRGRGNPLIVVDGVVFPGSALEPDNGRIELQGVNRGGLAGLNPNDIESIEVLKDASASIYGVSASNGVILITTKKGNETKMNVTYSGNRSAVRIMDYLEPLNAQDYMTYYNQLAEDNHYLLRTMEPYGVIPAGGFTVPYSDEIIAAAGEGTNWLEEVLRPGSIDNHSLTVNGGNDKVTYYFSGNYFNQKGILEHSDMQKFTGRLNVSFQLAKRVKLNTNVSANRNFYTNSGAGWQAGGSGTQGYGALQSALAYDPSLPVKYDDGSYSQFSIIANPVVMMEITDNTMNNGIMSNLSLDVDIVPQLLKAKLLYGNNYETAYRDFYIPSDIFWGQLYQARGSLSENKRQNQTMEGMLSLNKKLGDFLAIDAVAGIGQYQDDYSSIGLEAFDMLDALNTTGLQAAPTSYVSSGKSVEKKRSYFTRANLDILDKYLLMFGLRYDGYDKFFPENKYAAFPSASIGWKLTNEPFLENINQLNLLKLRASIGTTGNPWGTTAMGRFQPDMNGARQVQVTFNDGQVIYPAYLLVAFDQLDLEWEKTIMSNIGLDFSLFKSRLSGSVDVFKDERPNLIYSNAPTPPLASIQTRAVNAGHQVRTGYELVFNTINVSTGIFEWTSTLNISHYELKWVERAPYEGLESYIQETDPVNSIYVYETDGILQIDQEPSNFQPANANKPGSPIFVDKDGNDSLDNKDVVRYDTDPNLIIGFGNNLKIKNWDIGVFFYGQLGAYGWNNSYAWADPRAFVEGRQNASQDIKNVWSTHNTDGTIPGLAYNESTLGLSAGVDSWLTKKDFVRCRNITIGYTFNIPSLKEHFSNLRVYFDAQNPFIFTEFTGGDPEVNFPKPRVSAAAPYPMTRTFSFGVNASF